MIGPYMLFHFFFVKTYAVPVCEEKIYAVRLFLVEVLTISVILSYCKAECNTTTGRNMYQQCIRNGNTLHSFNIYSS
jgi:hypothetical protein